MTMPLPWGVGLPLRVVRRSVLQWEPWRGAKSALTAIEGKTGFLKAFADTTQGSELPARDLGKTWSVMSGV